MVRPRYCRTNSKCDRVWFFLYRSEEMAASGATIMPQKANQKVMREKLVVIVFYDSGYIENEKVSKTHYSYLAISNYRQLCVKFL